MANRLIYPAPAKINLFLHITSRRADGYHNLQTIFQFLDYCDELTFSIRQDRQLTCNSGLDLPPEQNLAFRAAKLLQHVTNTHLGVDIQVNKKIPLGGGLGGGSSDAATTLLALNKAWQLNLPKIELAKLGLTLGADVPIFIEGKASWAEGVGEILTPVTLDESWYLVIHPGCHVSTQTIFTTPHLTRNMPAITMLNFLEGHTINVFESIVSERYPEVKRALEWLTQFSPARMTGTGACLFAKFDCESDAKQVLQKLPSEWQGFIAQSKNISPATTNFTDW